VQELAPTVAADQVRRADLTWPRAHWFVGTLMLMLFPLAGVYMRYIAVVPQLDDAPRLVFRSRFLFLLLIAVANLAMSYAQPKRFIQRLASALILAAPVPLVAAFFLDPSRGVRSSPWTILTMRGLFLAAALLAFAQRPRVKGY
jgi:hypothetical protein